MNYAMPVVAQESETEVRSRLLMVPCTRRVTAQPAANEEAPVDAGRIRAVDPMLLVYQERVETFRLIAASLRRCYRVLARSFAG